MKKLNPRFILFVLFAVISVYAPLSIIWKYENTLRHGTLYKFRTQPVDPYDAFRGRYVTLAFDNESFEQINKGKSTEELKEEVSDSYLDDSSRLLYVRIAADAEGFAKPVLASLTPISGGDVITVDSWHKYVSKDTEQWTLSYPFDRYYLPEDMAPEAEKLYRQANRRSGDDGKLKSPSYVTVRVGNGVGVLEDLYIGGKPVREALRAELEKKRVEE